MSFALSRAYGTNSALLTTTCSPSVAPHHYSQHRIHLPPFLHMHLHMHLRERDTPQPPSSTIAGRAVQGPRKA
jgi:hypothetical protein